MKDLIGKNIKVLQGSSRLISVQGNEAIVLEKFKNVLNVYVCVLDDSNLVTSYVAYNDLKQHAVLDFLCSTDKGKTIVTGIRIGPLHKGDHLRRIVVLKNKRKSDASHFIKVEPYTRKDSEWEHNGSGWIPVTRLGHKVSGLIVFIRNMLDDALIKINDQHTQEGVFFLDEGYEVYIESVMDSFAFGKLIPRGL